MRTLIPTPPQEFKAKLDDPGYSGAVLFAVCRGKVSEGLDFSDRAGRGVVITGIPFSATHAPEIRLQRQVRAGVGGRGCFGGGGLGVRSALAALGAELARAAAAPLAPPSLMDAAPSPFTHTLSTPPRSLPPSPPPSKVLDDELRSGQAGLTRGRGVSGEQWYVQQAARAVNQAMGRVIRHRCGTRGAAPAGSVRAPDPRRPAGGPNRHPAVRPASSPLRHAETLHPTLKLPPHHTHARLPQSPLPPLSKNKGGTLAPSCWRTSALARRRTSASSARGSARTSWATPALAPRSGRSPSSSRCGRGFETVQPHIKLCAGAVAIGREGGRSRQQ